MHHAKKKKEKKNDTSSLWNVNIILLMITTQHSKKLKQAKSHYCEPKGSMTINSNFTYRHPLGPHSD